jgi:hypothetical protein
LSRGIREPSTPIFRRVYPGNGLGKTVKPHRNSVSLASIVSQGRNRRDNPGLVAVDEPKKLRDGVEENHLAIVVWV